MIERTPTHRRQCDSRMGPYYVSRAASTPEERGPGWFWVDLLSGRIHGPYFSVEECRLGMFIGRQEFA